MPIARMSSSQKSVEEQWEDFRPKLKGLPTADKLCELEVFYELTHEHIEYVWALKELTRADAQQMHSYLDREIDRYIRSLCRGGQLVKGTTLQKLLDLGWNSADNRPERWSHLIKK